MIYDITQEDIQKGRPHDPTGCMIHRALERAGFKGIHIFPQFMHYMQGGETGQVLFSDEITAKIIAFDDPKDTVSPFSIELSERVATLV